VNAILPAIRDWFLAKETHLRTFAALDSRLEGWFKGEMFVLLDELRRQRRIDSFDREECVTTESGRIQIDFVVHLEGEAHYCESKALCISQAAGTPRNLRFYLREDEVGLIRDFRKLSRLTEPGEKWILAFVYPNPLEKWAESIAALPQDLRAWRCITTPDDFPAYLYIALWRLDPTT
jgi:hypothetical protein